ncbi:MAG: 2-dehydropantoate 2-reductase [Pseudomonadota bacterium]|nr:2-dehydropantoate 2-reductase [Pseudomonadota bacterium]
MKIAVIGTGAMGSVYAGLLAEAGNEVWAVDLWREHLDAIRDRGLRIEGASGDRIVRTLNVTDSPDAVGICNLVIIATKASGVGAAAASIASIVGKDSLVLTIQNGLGAGERIAQHLPTDNVLLGVAGGFGASVKAPGHVHHNGMELIRVGEMHGGLSDRLNDVADVWQQAGFNVKAFADINQLIWEKFICNVTFSAPCTVFGRTLSEIMNDPFSWKIALGCALEAYEAGCAKKVALSFSDTEQYVRDFCSKMPDARPSMLLDHLDRRPSEIDAINGMVPVVAVEVGTRAPYNEVVTAIVKSREAEFG